MSARGGIVSTRKNQLLKSIHNIQREQIKSQKRAHLSNTINPPAEVYRLKQILNHYNIQYFPQEILEILNSVRKFAYDSSFCIELKKSHLLDDLLMAILGELDKKSYLQAPELAEQIVLLSSDLIVQVSFFLQSVEEHLDLFLSVLNRYPSNHKIVQRVASIISYAQLVSTPWKQQFLSRKIANLETLIPKLIDIYTVQESYQTWSGSTDFMEFVERKEHKWLQNAIYVFQISYSLLLLSPNRQQILKMTSLKSCILISLQAYLQQVKHIPSLQEELDLELQSTDHYPSNPQYYCELWDHLISLILELILLREQLVSEPELNLLKQNLKVGLHHFNKAKTGILIKVMRILYQQVILTEEQLQSIATEYKELKNGVNNIIDNDFL